MAEAKKSIKKMAGYSHRTATTAYPCCIPALGRFSRSWPCKTCHCKGNELLQDADANPTNASSLSTNNSSCPHPLDT